MVNTVLGPISPDALGVTLGHEHIFVGSGEMLRARGVSQAELDRMLIVNPARLFR